MANFQEKINFIRDEWLDLLEHLQEQEIKALEVLGNFLFSDATNARVSVHAWQCAKLYLSLKENVLSMVAQLDRLEDDIVHHCCKYAM